jgi:CheY-like chemotaxis protein
MVVRRSGSQRGHTVPEESSLIGLSVQPARRVRCRRGGVAIHGDARGGPRSGTVPTVSLRRLRVAVASPDPALTERVAGLVRTAGHEVTLATDSRVDAMEAAFSHSVEVLVLDHELERPAGLEIAGVVRSLGSAVAVVVLHRGELAADDDILTLDPDRPGFHDALGNALDGLAGGPAETPPAGERRRAG